MAKPRLDGTITAEQVRAAVDYDPVTGEFRHKVRVDQNALWNGRYAGKTAGKTNRLGYRMITINDRGYQAHRLAFLLMTGEWPINNIDHINGEPGDNRWSNLRPATQSENVRNKRAHAGSKSGLKGAHWNKLRSQWVSQIMHERQYYHLGYFDTAEEAHAAYVAKAKELHGEFARTA